MCTENNGHPFGCDLHISELVRRTGVLYGRQYCVHVLYDTVQYRNCYHQHDRIDNADAKGLLQ